MKPTAILILCTLALTACHRAPETPSKGWEIYHVTWSSQGQIVEMTEAYHNPRTGSVCGSVNEQQWLGMRTGIWTALVLESADLTYFAQRIYAASSRREAENIVQTAAECR